MRPKSDKPPHPVCALRQLLQESIVAGELWRPRIPDAQPPRLSAYGWLWLCNCLHTLCFCHLHRLCNMLWSWPWCWPLLHAPGFWWMHCCPRALTVLLRFCYLLSWRIIITVAKVYGLVLTSLHTNGHTAWEEDMTYVP